MQSGSYWAYREAAELQDRDDYPPQMHVLWDKRHTARKAHLCAICDEEISPGSRYRSVGMIYEGVFEVQKTHFPVNCPRFAERDRAELAAQFEADRDQFFPPESSLGDGMGGDPSPRKAARDEPIDFPNPTRGET